MDDELELPFDITEEDVDPSGDLNLFMLREVFKQQFPDIEPRDFGAVEVPLPTVEGGFVGVVYANADALVDFFISYSDTFVDDELVGEAIDLAVDNAVEQIREHKPASEREAAIAAFKVQLTPAQKKVFDILLAGRWFMETAVSVEIESAY